LQLFLQASLRKQASERKLAEKETVLRFLVLLRYGNENIMS
jgi:hypothetical protein